jgi:hypothetical protein
MIGLFDGDGRRNSLDELGLRLVHPLEELARIRTESLHVTPLPLSIKGIEGKTRLATTAGSRDDDELPKRQVKVYTAEIILTRAADAYDRGHRPFYDGNSSRRAVFLHIFELLGAQQDTLTHNFTGLELYRCSGWNDDVVLGLVGVTPDTRLG